MSERITITETTVADVAGIRVAVSHVWDEDYEDRDGQTVHGVRGTLRVMGDEPENDFDQRVSDGDETTIGGQRFRVVRVSEPPAGLGSVTLEGIG